LGVGTVAAAISRGEDAGVVGAGQILQRARPQLFDPHGVDFCGIWKASELNRMLAERGLVISAGKMSGLWSGNPNTIKLDELDVICAVLGCGVEELLVPEPDTVPAPSSAADEHTATGGH
jgi:DNA-binding Xre family transcriptional regulator